MNITFNGREEVITEEIRLADLLKAKGYKTARLVVQLNRQILRSGEWDETIIRPGDELDVLHFVGGG